MSRPTRIAALSIVAALALMLGVSALSAGGAGCWKPTAGVTVSGRVFYDLNMNGIFDAGEHRRRWRSGRAARCMVRSSPAIRRRSYDQAE